MALSIEIKEIHIKESLQVRGVAYNGWGDGSESGRWYEVAITRPDNRKQQVAITSPDNRERKQQVAIIRTLVTHNSSHFKKWVIRAEEQYEKYQVIGVHIECVHLEKHKNQGVTAAIIMAVGDYCIIYQPAFDEDNYEKIHEFLDGKTSVGINLKEQFRKFCSDYRLESNFQSGTRIEDLGDKVSDRRSYLSHFTSAKKPKDLTLNDFSEKIFGCSILNPAITSEGWNDSPLRNVYVMYGTVSAVTCFELAHSYEQGNSIRLSL